MRVINKIINHCADTPEGMYFDIDNVRDWHINPKKLKNGKYKYKGRLYEFKDCLPKKVRNSKGNGWTDVGYHFVVLLDGTVQVGRQLKDTGAHCYGQNKNSIGICYIGGAKGKDTRTDAQKKSLLKLNKQMKQMFPKAETCSHYEFSNKKCPNFNAKKEYKNI